MQNATTEERLLRLERTITRQRMLFALALVALITFGFYKPEGAAPDVIRAKKFIVENEAGGVGMSIDCDEDVGSGRMNVYEGEDTVIMIGNPAGLPWVVIKDPESDAIAGINIDKAAANVSCIYGESSAIMLANKATAGVALYDSEGNYNAVVVTE